MLTDTIADTLTRIRNGQQAKHATVRTRYSKMVGAFLQVLQDEGFIAGYEQVKDRENKFDQYEVTLRYLSNGEPVISQATRVSKPGCRVYSGSGDLPKVHRGLGIAVISTSKGLMADRLARKEQVGGEVLAYIN